MNIRAWQIALLVVVLAAGAGGYWVWQASREVRAACAGRDLQTLAGLLKEDQILIQRLQADAATEKGAGILQAYLMQIRRDGVAQHASMKQRLDQLAENNSAIVALLKAYSPWIKTPALNTETDKFVNYAAAWRDRWNSVMELFMAGGNYPAAEVPFPGGFLDALQAEIAAVR